MAYIRTGRKRGRPSKQSEIRAWLGEFVDSGLGGMQVASRIEAEGLKRGYSFISIRRAKSALGLKSKHVGNQDGNWVWFNPLRPQPANGETEGYVLTKAQSLALIAEGWIPNTVERLFNEGKSLNEVRSAMTGMNRFLAAPELAEIKSEYLLSASDMYQKLDRRQSEVQKHREKPSDYFLTQSDVLDEQVLLDKDRAKFKKQLGEELLYQLIHGTEEDEE